MKNIFTIAIALTIVTNIVQLSAYSKNTANKTEVFKPNSSSKIKRTKKPVYYQGHSFGLQNYPGKTIDACANTGMLPTNSSSPLMGNDVTF